MSALRPRPVADLHSEPYWQGLRDHALLVQECDDCLVRLHPSRPCCPRCLSTDLRWVRVSGAGVVVGYSVVAQPFVAGISTPYTVLLVSFSDAPGVELIANLVKGDSDVSVGDAVRVSFDVIDDELTLANFQLDANAA